MWRELWQALVSWLQGPDYLNDARSRDKLARPAGRPPT